MKNQNILLVGCGDIGSILAKPLVERGARVWGLRRRPEFLPDYIQPIAADVTDPGTLGELANMAFDYVVMTLTPAGFSERGYESVFVDGVANILAALKTQAALKRLFHVSSTRVYHQSHGEWVDEESRTEPAGFAGQTLLRAEGLLAAGGIPVTVVRFAGIYGPGRGRLIDQVLAGRGCPREPVLYSNRIHRDDCVGVLAHLLDLDRAGVALRNLYLGVDDEPAPLWEVKRWLARRLGVVVRDDVEPDQNRGNSKRCRNRLLRQSGYPLRYPSYRHGYEAVLRSL